MLSHLRSPPPLGLVSLSQALCSSDDYSNSLLHLDLSKNPGVLSGDDATVSTNVPNNFKLLSFKEAAAFSKSPPWLFSGIVIHIFFICLYFCSIIAAVKCLHTELNECYCRRGDAEVTL